MITLQRRSEPPFREYTVSASKIGVILKIRVAFVALMFIADVAALRFLFPRGFQIAGRCCIDEHQKTAF